MGITLSGNDILATVFTYNGYGCSPQAVFTVTPDPFGIKPATMTPLVNGYPFQFPFGMDPDRNGIIIIADEGSGYGCSGTIFRLDLSMLVQKDPHQPNPNPFALSPYFGLGCTPPNQAYLSTPSDVAVVKVLVTVNIATNTAPSNVSVSVIASTINENDGTSLSGTFADPDTSDTHTVTMTWGDGSPDTVLNLAAGVLTIPATTHQYLDNAIERGLHCDGRRRRRQSKCHRHEQRDSK